MPRVFGRRRARVYCQRVPRDKLTPRSEKLLTVEVYEEPGNNGQVAQKRAGLGFVWNDENEDADVVQKMIEPE